MSSKEWGIVILAVIGCLAFAELLDRSRFGRAIAGVAMMIGALSVVVICVLNLLKIAGVI